MEGIASSLETQKRRHGDSDLVSSGIDAARPGGESQGMAFGDLAFRPKAT